VASLVAVEMPRIEWSIRALFRGPDRAYSARRRASSDHEAECKAASEQVRDGLRRLDAVLGGSRALMVGRYMNDHGRVALEALAPLLRLTSIPIVDEAPRAPVDLVIHQLWRELNGGKGRCRACNEKLLPKPKRAKACPACGSRPPYAYEEVTRGSSFGCLWWEGKAKPQDLGLMLILGQVHTSKEWATWANKKDQTPETILAAVAHHVAVRLKELRDMMIDRRRRVHELSDMGHDLSAERLHSA
jgi:hypothetical protein